MPVEEQSITTSGGLVPMDDPNPCRSIEIALVLTIAPVLVQLLEGVCFDQRLTLAALTSLIEDDVS